VFLPERPTPTSRSVPGGGPPPQVLRDPGQLPHSGMDRLFTGIRAPSTMGTFLRTFTFGHVRQLATATGLLTEPAGRTSSLAGADQVPCVDTDDTIRATTRGCVKQGAGFDCSGVKGLNALLAVVSTPAVAAGDHGDPVAGREDQLGTQGRAARGARRTRPASCSPTGYRSRGCAHVGLSPPARPWSGTATCLSSNSSRSSRRPM
jgi:hypothetical protein